MNKINYWIQANKTKWYCSISMVALLIFLFVKNGFWNGVGVGMFTVSFFYFLGILIKRIKNNK